jgi:hypothetical protein
MSIHLDGLNANVLDDFVEFAADVNGKRICCAIARSVLEHPNFAGTGSPDLISVFKQNWPKIRDVAYRKIQMDRASPSGFCFWLKISGRRQGAQDRQWR